MPMSVEWQSEADGAGEKFYSGAVSRIGRFMLFLAAVLVGAGWWKFGARAALGFAVGCAIAWVNFFWLKRAITGFVDRAAGAAASGTGSGVVARFLLRYFLMAIGAYVILTVSPASLNGLLAGLFLPVAGILCEAAYEVYAALSRGV
ncbi:MAG TPA: ATP synthase subunit I [Candidatus Binatia bacterium]|nr:ATP synthase subunit I [Candidatus Binatia bacterium]